MVDAITTPATVLIDTIQLTVSVIANLINILRQHVEILEDIMSTRPHQLSVESVTTTVSTVLVS